MMEFVAFVKALCTFFSSFYFISMEPQQREIFTGLGQQCLLIKYSAVEKDNGKQIPEETTLHIQEQDVFRVLCLLQWQQGVYLHFYEVGAYCTISFMCIYE